MRRRGGGTTPLPTGGHPDSPDSLGYVGSPTPSNQSFFPGSKRGQRRNTPTAQKGTHLLCPRWIQYCAILLLGSTMWLSYRSMRSVRETSGWKDWIFLTYPSGAFQLDSFDYEEKTASHTVFYNIFIPEDGRHNTLRIVKEQMQQVEEALATEPGQPPVRLYYYTIGQELPNVLKEHHFRERYCSGGSVRCIHGGHTPEGDEDFTLQALYQFAQQQPSHNQHHRVTYLHAKGTYHHSAINERWRFHLTAAALHPHCRLPPNGDACSVCGLQFFTEWALLFPGNMWTAQISYIQQLLPPGPGFATKLEDAAKELLFLQWQGVLNNHLYDLPQGEEPMDRIGEDRIDRLGLDRYHMEHWIASHPTVRPCDLTASADLAPWLKLKDNRKAFVWQSAPRHGGGPADQIDATTRAHLWDQHDPKREQYLLAGLLLKFAVLYQMVPPPDSWMFAVGDDILPNGRFWKQLAHNHGDSGGIGPDVLSHYLPAQHNIPSLEWRDEEEDTAARLAKDTSTFDNVRHVIFLPLLQDEWDQQLDAIQQSLPEHRGAQDDFAIYHYSYKTSDSNQKDIDKGIASNVVCSEIAVQCQPLPSIASEQEDGVILQEIHQYCVDHPKSTVTYLGAYARSSNQANDHQDAMETDVANVVLGECALKTIDDNRKTNCNLCGSSTFSGAGFSFLHNTWTARCSYVSKLLQPQDYIKGMTEVAKTILVLKSKRRLVLKHFQDKGRDQYLPIEERALPYWITSHPDASICSTSSSIVETSTEFQPDTKGMEETDVIQECAFLACHILRWQLLYPRQLPDASSWVWSWFPGAERWAQSGIGHIDTDAVEQVTGPLADTKV